MRHELNSIELACILPEAASRLSQIGGEMALSSMHTYRIGAAAVAEFRGVMTPWALTDLRRWLREQGQDDQVREVVLHLDSPGGLTSGCHETAEEVFRLQRQKLVTTIGENYLCSAAYHVGCMATEVVATKSTLVGSCGVIVLLLDDSEAFAKSGLRAVPITTAGAKTIGMPGVPITDEHVERTRRRVYDVANTFEADIDRSPRRIGGAEAMADGDVWHGPQAKGAGYIDAHMLVEDAFEAVRQRSGPKPFANLRGDMALQKFEQLLCEASGKHRVFEAYDDTKALASIRIDYPELSAEAERERTEERRRAQRRRNP